MTHDEKDVLFKLAKNSQGLVVEIGSYLGASSCFLAAGLSGKQNAKLICVDTWQNDAMSEGPRDTFHEFMHNTVRFKEVIQPIRGTSTEIARSFKGKIDLIFFDADHDYSGIKQDWDAWSPYLNDIATVAFHDISWAEGVQRVIQEDVQPLVISDDKLPNLYWAQVRREPAA